MHRGVAGAKAEALVNDSRFEVIADATGNRSETGASTFGKSSAEGLGSFRSRVCLLRLLLEQSPMRKLIPGSAARRKGSIKERTVDDAE